MILDMVKSKRFILDMSSYLSWGDLIGLFVDVCEVNYFLCASRCLFVE